MQIDFRAPDSWLKLNDTLAESLGIDLDKNKAHIYQGVAHALVEICVGLTKLYPLKKKIYYFKNMNPLFEAVLMPLARDGYKLVPLSLDVLHSQDEWLAKLEREDLFVLYSADEPLLGRSYDLQKFEEKIKDKNIFKIKVSHGQHFYNFDELMKFKLVENNKAVIYSLARDMAIAVLGERGRVGAITADQLYYRNSYSLDWFQKSRILDLNKIESFEQKKIADSKPIFKPGDFRVPDRAVIYWQDMDGAAVIDRLAESLNIQLNPPGEEIRLETTSLSRWGGVRTMSFLESQGLSPEIIRGLVIIHHDFLDSHGEFEKTLIEVRNSILKDQLGG